MQQHEIRGFRLSPQQERIWRLTEEEPGSAYRARAVVELVGPLDAELLERTFCDLHGRHEILRTSYRRVPGMSRPLQVIEDRADVLLARHDLRRLDSRRRSERIEAILAGQGQERDLTSPPLLAAALVTLAAEDHLLLLDAPALSADAETLARLLRELGELYAAQREGLAAFDEPVQYVDVSEWQHEMRESPEILEAGKFWRDLDVASGLGATLPFGHEVERRTAFAPDCVASTMGPSLAEAIEAQAVRLGVDPSAILLGCWQHLLLRLTDRPSLAIGVTRSGRHYQDVAEVLGPLARCLPFKTRAASARFTFRELFAAVESGERSLDEWQDAFDWREIADPGESAPAVFDFGFEILDLAPGFAAGGVTWRLKSLRARLERFVLQLACKKVNGHLVTEFHYDTNVLERRDVERLSGWYEVLLGTASRQADRPVEDVGLMTEQERRCWIAELNSTEMDFGFDGTLSELVEDQARRTPHSVALIFADRALTYGELDARSTRLARRLGALGCGPEARVALAVERSPQMVIAILAVLKAGAAYVPLDPGHPRARLAFMLKDSRASVLLARDSGIGALPETSAVLLTDFGEADSESAELESACRATPQNLAYVIYTSGSTGRPKGVMVSHRAIVNRLLWMRRVFPLGVTDTLLQKTPFSFDASIWEIFMPLAAGGRLILAEPGGHRDADYLLEQVVRERVTTLQLVPSQVPAFLEQPKAEERSRSLRRLFCGGEALPAALARRAAARLSAEVINLYGPTENAIDATFHVCSEQREGMTPIGRPLDNIRVHVMDHRQRYVPPGLVGELYLDGAGQARGYLGQPALSAERFVPHPVSPSPGARLYRTGDLSRLGPDGEVEFLGRADELVKVRGFRVEPGEIESRLAAHPAVRSVVVVLRGETPPERRLVAYVVPRAGVEPPAAEKLNEFLRRDLPDYMVPAAFAWIDTLPRLANGKLDRRALPEPEEHDGRRREVEAARTPVEEILVGLWAEMLGTSKLGRNSDFFTHGGHSLLATRLLSRVRELFGVELKVRDLFSAPTLSEFAACIDAAVHRGNRLSAPPIVAVSRHGDTPLSFAQERLWFLDRLEPDNPAYNLVSALHLSGELRFKAFVSSLNEITRRHEALRTVFVQHHGEPVQKVVAARPRPMPVIDLGSLVAARRDAEAQRLASELARRPFDLASGPLVRACLVRAGEREHIALFTLHHIISDGWSVGVMIDELSQLYRAFVTGRPAPLAELAVQYGDFAHWQRQWLRGDILAEEIAYWREHLSGTDGVLDLPTDRPRPALQSYRGAALRFHLPAAVQNAVQTFGAGRGVTPFMLLLAVFETVLSRWADQRLFNVGTPIAGRNHLELEGLIGFFVNTLVLRADLMGDPDVTELLGRVRREALQAYTHQELPFEKLVEELDPRRSLAHSPLFQVMFMFQNAPAGALELPGLEVEPFAIEQSASKFDLTLLVAPTGEGMTGVLEYNIDLFDAATVERLAGHFRTLLEGALDAPEKRLSRISLLSEAELGQLHTMNETRYELGTDTTLSDLFAAQVRRSPHACAVVTEDQELTYAELSRRADRVARRLRSLGVGRGTCVAIGVERSVEMLAGILGILKAGGAYVPLDASYPRERLAFMLEDSRAGVVLTAARGVAGLAGSHVREVGFDEIERLEDGVAPASCAGPDDLAYVIYTSGSTGRPKGVMVSHRAILNRLLWMRRVFVLSSRDCVLQKTPYSFDASIWEMFVPLLSGARVALARPDGHLDVGYLREAVGGFGVTTLQLVPSQLAAFMEPSGWEASCTTLRRLFCGGEALPAELVRRFRARHGAELCNLYGPTEAAIDVTFHPCDEDPHQSHTPIGQPLDNVRAWVLDRSNAPAAPGVPGELHAGGAGLARGYLARPGLTAERFVPDPLSEAPGERLYHTGDRARWVPSNYLEFLGRIDQQVKVRGFRIEVGEIESRLLEHPAVSEALVVPHGEGAADRLVAYVTATSEAPPPEDLSRFLAASLPRYMVPASFVNLEDLPRTPSGKLDRSASGRKSLPAPVFDRAYSERAFVAPRTPTEQIVAVIWAELLALDDVGVHDNFFDLGGHSLAAARVCSRISETFGVEVAVRELFAHSSVESLSEAVDFAMVAAAGDARFEELLRKVEAMESVENNVLEPA